MPRLSRRILIAAGFTCIAAPVAAQSAAGDARALLGLINGFRSSQGVAAVTIDPRLTRAAQQHADAMAAARSVSHDVGGSFDARMNAHGIRGSAAENVAGGHADVAAVFADWQTSSGHSDNMRNPRMRKIGLGRARGSDGRNYWALVLSG